VSTLALGISLTATIFSILTGVLGNLPFVEPDRIVALDTNNLSRGVDSRGVASREYLAWKDEMKSLEGLAAFSSGSVNLSGNERPERFEGAFITANAFPLLRVRPVLGRLFLPEEDRPGAPQVVLLGHDVWKNRYGSDPQILGKSIRVNGDPATVVGVMPSGFQFPVRQSVWIPLKLDPAKVALPENELFLFTVARLRPGFSLDQANGEAAVLARRYAQQHPATNEGVSAVVKPYTHVFVDEEDRAIQFTGLALVSLVLLIACFNVANLLVAKTLNRSKEVAVRSALGASRAQVIRHLLIESLLLSLLGAAIAIGLTFLGVRLFNTLIVDPDRPFWIVVRVDHKVVLFAIAAALVSSLVAGLLPALQASKADLTAVLKDESRGSSSFRLSRLSKGLVVVELALSYGLLIAAGLTVHTVLAQSRADLGFKSRNIFTARIGLSETAYPEGPQRIAFFDELLRRLRSVPGVTSVALTSHLPTSGTDLRKGAVEGRAYATNNDYPTLRLIVVSPGFFETFGIPILQGQGFQPDGAAQAAVIVNRSFADRVWPGGAPLGKRIRLGTSNSNNPWLTVMGVVADVQLEGTGSRNLAAVYLPLVQDERPFMSLAVRTAGPPMAITAAVREQVQAMDKDLPIYFVKSMDEVVAQSLFLLNVIGSVCTIFGLLAFFLAMVGLSGIMSHSVSRRTSELGVRRALGAQTRDVVRLILRQAMRQILGGLGVGLLVAVVTAKLVNSVFGVQPWEPLTFLLTAAGLILVGIVACLIPARSATRVDPMVALQSQ
jgi:predicted permease